jgi:hypothetical protein
MAELTPGFEISSAISSNGGICQTSLGRLLGLTLAATGTD